MLECVRVCVCVDGGLGELKIRNSSISPFSVFYSQKRHRLKVNKETVAHVNTANTSFPKPNDD